MEWNGLGEASTPLPPTGEMPGGGANLESSSAIDLFLNVINSTPSPAALQSIDKYEKELSTEVVSKAIYITQDQRKGISYLKAILQRYKAEGIDSLAKLEAQERDWEERKQSAQSTQGDNAAEMDYLATLTPEEKAHWGAGV